MRKRWYSVLLLYPDYMSDGVKTYYDFVQAYSPMGAVLLARLHCTDANKNEIDNPYDLLVLLITRGRNKGEEIDGL